MTTDLKENLLYLRSRISDAARKAGRQEGDVKLVAVSKTVEPGRIAHALKAGIRVFGENYVQEARAKWPALRADFPGLELHLIGHLQSNKAEEAVALFDVIATLDRPKLAHALHKAMQKQGRHVPLLIEVNIGDEPQKSGCATGDVQALLTLARDTLGLDVRGLMCVPPAGADPVPYFRKLADLADRLGLKERSMGMSGDFEAAIAMGATQIRLGTALFGARA